MPVLLASGLSSTLYSRSWIQPILFALTGAAAAYALMTAHSHYVKWQRKGRPALRRRNAVRRSNRTHNQRSTIAQEAPTDYGTSIRALERQEQTGGIYGQWQVYIHGGAVIGGGLIPREVVMPQSIMELDIGTADAVDISQVIETAFIENFLIMEIPPEHYIGPGEESFLVAHLSRRFLNPELVRSCIARFNESVNFRQAVIAERAAGLGTGAADIQVTTPFEFGSRYARSEANAPTPRNRASIPPVTSSTPSDSILPLPLPTSAQESPSSQPISQLQAAEQPHSANDQASDFSFKENLEEDQPGRDGQNLLNLLYQIADDQARKDGYVHRGVACNSCSVMPIQGIRYRCANCIDYDLCETCEVMQVHNKTHLFYKIRVPAPFLGDPRQVQPVIYPGKPDALPRTTTRSLTKRLLAESGFEIPELEALWDQFRCLANAEWLEDPNKLCMAIDRKTFDRCFVPNLSSGPPTPSLIYDRMFAYYDTNDDGFIGFEEFVKGLSSLTNRGRNERLRRTFDSFDLDRDGYIERKDMLRVFRAYYVLTREFTRETATQLDDDIYDGNPRDTIMGSAPISSAFPVTLDPTDSGNRHVHGRTNEGKRLSQHGDMDIADGEGLFKPDEDLTRDREVVIGNAAVRSAFSTTSPMRRLRHLLHPNRAQHMDEDFYDDDNDLIEDDTPSSIGDSSNDYKECELYPSFFDHIPPDCQIKECDIVVAMGAYVPLEEITDPVDRARIGYYAILRLDTKDAKAMDSLRRHHVCQRWERRQFYTDEEDGSRPPLDWTEDDEDSDHDESESARLPPSPRSRSSSKVRFQDDVTDNEYDTFDTRSNASSRSIPMAERWGGFDIPEAERDVGKEILYQITQEGINELLDVLFKAKEDLMIDVVRTKGMRRRLAKDINNFVNNLPSSHPLKLEGKSVLDHDKGDAIKPLNTCGLNRNANGDGTSRSSILSGMPDIVRNSLNQDLPDHQSDQFMTRVDSHAGSDLAAHDSRIRLDPTLPQNRPNTPDLQASEPDALVMTGDDIWDGPNERPRLTHENAEGSLITARTMTPDQHQAQDAVSFPSALSSTNSIPMASLELYPSHVSYGDQEDIIPQDSLLPSVSDELPQSSPQFQSQILHTESLPPLEESNSLSPHGCCSMNDKMHSNDEASVSLPQLERLADLNKAEREAERRGGNVARLNFEEFAAKMQKERQLDFLVSWIDVTSF